MSDCSDILAKHLFQYVWSLFFPKRLSLIFVLVITYSGLHNTFLYSVLLSVIKKQNARLISQYIEGFFVIHLQQFQPEHIQQLQLAFRLLIEICHIQHIQSRKTFCPSIIVQYFQYQFLVIRLKSLEQYISEVVSNTALGVYLRIKGVPYQMLLYLWQMDLYGKYFFKICCRVLYFLFLQNTGHILLIVCNHIYHVAQVYCITNQTQHLKHLVTLQPVNIVNHHNDRFGQPRKLCR